MKIVWEYGLSTHVGPVKKVNEDRSFFRFVNKNKSHHYAIALIADGMGGYQAGDMASELAVSKIKDWWDSHSREIEAGTLSLNKGKESIKATFAAINDELIMMSRQNGVHAGTTLSVILFHDNQYLICHVGDSRIYQLASKDKNLQNECLLDAPNSQPPNEARTEELVTQPLNEGDERDLVTQPICCETEELMMNPVVSYPWNKGSITQLTTDHSWVEREVKRGNLTREEARLHPKRNVLLQCLGIEKDLEVYVDEGYINEGDIFLLCSDGFYSLFADVDISDFILKRIESGKCSLQAISDELVEMAYSNGATDNISVILLQRMTIDSKGLRGFLSNLIKV